MPDRPVAGEPAPDGAGEILAWRAALAASEQRLHDLVEAIHDPVISAEAVRDASGVIVDFRYVAVNSAAGDLIHRDARELLGQLASEVLPNVLREDNLQVIRSVVEDGRSHSVEVGREDHGLDERVWDVTYTPFGDGFVALAHDVTVRRSERERLRRILEVYGAEVSMLSTGGVITWTSPSVRDVLGWDPEQLVGSAIFPLLHPDDLRGAVSFQQRLASGERQRMRCRVRQRDGGWRWMDTTSRRVVDVDGTAGDQTVVSLLWDVHHEVLAIESLERAEHDRAQLAERVRQAEHLESLGVLAGGIAHDFNNLLTGIVGNAELALDSAIDPAARRLLARIIESSDRAATLTQQMLDYAGRRPVRRDPVDLVAVVEAAARAARVSSPDSIAITVDAGAAARVVGDAAQLRSVIDHLLVNAVESLRGGGTVVVRVGVAADELADGAARDRLGDDAASPGSAPHVVVEVSDDGVGMPPEVEQRMFEPFFTTKGLGRGLGLSAVHGVVRSMHGSVAVETAVGAGTTVRMLLPASPAVPADADDVPPRGRVLVLDDDELVLGVVEEALRTTGHVVDGHSNVDDAVARFSADPDAVGVALVDLTLPGVSGTEVLARLRSRRGDLPAVLMSGHARPRMPEQEGVHTGFLQKPFGIDALLHEVSVALASARPRAAGRSEPSTGPTSPRHGAPTRPG